MEAIKSLAFGEQSDLVSVYGTTEEPIFLVTEVCGLIGLTNTSAALVKVDKDEKGVNECETLFID